MSLREYAKKRSFDKTPEPAPGPVSSHANHHSFCVQRHDATRLHYDFRLEMDGTLKSWAVPKGPSLEPLSKHLAMHVEDHPIDYGGFEGNIPKGEYGGGSVMLWDRGTWEPLGDLPPAQQLERGDLKFRLHGEKLKGEFALVRMRNRGKGDEWLIIKKRDAEAVPGWNIEDYAFSVLTGRMQQEIAENLPARTSTASEAAPEKAPPKKKVAATQKKSSRTAGTAKTRKWPPGALEAAMPESLDPMLAEIAADPPHGDEWVYEVKWDGVRALCFLRNGELRLYSRRGKRCEKQYPELGVLPQYVAASEAILDGEVAALDANGRPSFELIQPRISVGDANAVAHLARKSPVTLFLFDLLYLDGHDLRGATLLDRKELLAEILTPTERIRYSGHFAAQAESMLQAARENGLEGIISKRVDSKYEGRRSHNWLKVKVVNRQEFVICGFTHGERAYFSSLVLGLYRGGKLVQCGQVGTGFNEKNLAQIYALLEPLITNVNPFGEKLKRSLREITWVKPELVAEIKFLEFTSDGLLRAPVFLGLRPDKDPRDCVREKPAVSDAENDSDVARPAAPVEQKFSNLNKVFFPKDGITKGDLIKYYDDIAELILPHLKDRPLSLKRYPNGIHSEYFFQKNVADKRFPAWIQTVKIESESQDHEIEYVICNDKPTLLYLANLGCIDQNPWMSRVGSLDCPDFALIDLDPYECSYDKIIEAALLTRKTLDELGLAGYPKTTGGDGMHIYIPLQPIYSYEQVRSFAEILWRVIMAQKTDLFTTPRAVARRKSGRVYFDYLQIGRSKTISAPYVPRAYDGAPVATPLDWKEVKPSLTPDKFNLRNAVARFQKLGDIFAPVLTNLQTLDQPLERLDSLWRKLS